MARRIESLFIDGPAGRLEALLEEPDDAPVTEAALVCHPHPLHGGTMHNKVVYRLARGLRTSGSVVLRFNFRGVNRSEGVYAGIEGGVADAGAALSVLRERYPDLPFCLAGFSFGSRVILQMARSMCTDVVRPARLIPVGFPTVRGLEGATADCGMPVFFIHSTNDEFGPRNEVQGVFDSLSEPKQLHFVEATDHFFAGALDEMEAVVTRLPR